MHQLLLTDAVLFPRTVFVREVEKLGSLLLVKHVALLHSFWRKCCRNSRTVSDNNDDGSNNGKDGDDDADESACCGGGGDLLLMTI